MGNKNSQRYLQLHLQDAQLLALPMHRVKQGRKVNRDWYSTYFLPQIIIVVVIGSCRLSWRYWGSLRSRCAVAGGAVVATDAAGVGGGSFVAVVAAAADNAVAAAAVVVDTGTAAAAADRTGCSRHQGAASSYRVARACL